jgi:hypothetical protein
MEQVKFCKKKIHRMTPDNIVHVHGYQRCRECKRDTDRVAQRVRRAKQKGWAPGATLMNDPKKPKRYAPDPNDPDVLRARQERERVKRNRREKGPNWYKERHDRDDGERAA